MRSVYAFLRHPSWRWTHGYVANVEEAIALAAIHTSAVNRVYNVGERFTPSMGERLSRLPYRDVPAEDEDRFDFAHHLAYDTSRIRQELGFLDPISEEGAMLKVAQNIQ
jgi:nucleoside-diphosphate-sugar epimerase